MLKFHDFSKITDRDGFNFTLQYNMFLKFTMVLISQEMIYREIVKLKP